MAMVLGEGEVPSGTMDFVPASWMEKVRPAGPDRETPEDSRLQNHFDDNMEEPNLPRLTAKNLSFLDTEKPTATSTSTMSSRTASKTIGYTDPDFAVELERRNVFVAFDAYSTDWESTKRRIEQPTTDETELLAAPSRPVLPRGTIANIEHAKKVTLVAPNESIVTTEVVPSLVPVGGLLLSKEYDAITDSQWSSPALPALASTDNRLCVPKPDVTIGYKQSHLLNFLAIDNLKPFSTPVICRPELAFPCFCLEAKGLASTHFSTLQNRHNAAQMLRALYTLRSRANRAGWRDAFENQITVITASISKEKVAISGHWVTSSDGHLQYYTRVLKAWPTEHEDWAEIYNCINNAIFGILEKNKSWIVGDLRIMEEIEEGETVRTPQTKKRRYVS